MNRLLLLLLLAAPLPAQEPAERERVRVHFTTALAAPVAIEADGNAAAALEAYEAWKKGRGPMTADAMAKIYKAAGKDAKAFKTVAWLIGNGDIADADGVAMAQVRDAEIEKLITEIGQEKGWKITRSDSGNMSSGMKSDLDQTFYVFEGKEVDGTWDFTRKPTLDGDFIAEFNRRWEALHGPSGLSLNALDIASIEGRNRFPDPRVKEVNGFWNEHRRAAEALRNTPGAYTYAGAVGHQMQFRAFGEILKENPRAYQIYGPDAEGDWGNRGTDADEAVREMFGKRPDLRPAWAFGAALANYLELQGYMEAEKFETKYHLRTFEDSLFSQWLAERGRGRDSKVELVDLDPGERKAMYDALLDRLFADEEKRRLHELTLEISVDQRLAHKDEFGKIAAFADGVPEDADGKALKIFDRLGQALHGDAWREDPAALIEDVRREYRRLASEFCLETAYRTAPEALATLLGSDDPKHLQLDRYKELMGVSDAEWPEVRRRLQDSAHLTFLFGIHDLGRERSLELMNRLRKSHGLKVVPRLAGLWLRGQAQWLESRLREPGRYARLYLDHFKNNRAPEIADRVRRTVLSEIGYEHRTVIDRATGEITGRRLAWSGRKFLGNMAYDPGNLDALAQIARAFVESKGDWDVVMRTIAAEFVMSIPVVGQVAAGVQGGVAGLAVMGIAWAYPPAGGVIVAVSVASAGYAIWEVEKGRPEAENLVNAIYRGFMGPETYYFDRAPERYTDADQAELDRLRKILDNARPRSQVYAVRDLDALRHMQARVEAEKRAFAKVTEEVRPKIRALEQKKRDWEEFRDDPAYGGYFSGAGAIEHQRPFNNYLLASIRPVVGFSPAGLVDFAEDTPDAALDRAERTLRDAPDWETALKAEAEYTKTALRVARRQRAERYFARMTGRERGSVEGFDPREERMGNFELLFRMKRDSLYPELKRLGYDDPDAFVDAWLKDNSKVVHEAIRRDLLSASTGAIEWRLTYPRPTPHLVRRTKLPAGAIAALKARLRADVERSRELLERHRALEKKQQERAERDLARRLEIVEAAAAGVAVEQLGADPALRALYEVMRTPVAPPTAPRFEATVYVTEKGYDLAAEIAADPAVFAPPYRTELRSLDAKEARRLADTGRASGLVVFPSTVQRLRELFAGKKSDAPGMYVFVVSAFATKVADTVDGVPGREGRRLIGQSLTVVFERDEKLEWFLNDDANVPWAGAQHLAKKFPGLVGDTHEKRKPVVRDRNPFTFRPRAYAIEWETAKAHLRRDPTNAFHLHDDYKGPMHVKLSCRGQVRHAYYVEREGRTVLLFKPRLALPDGEHVVGAEVELGNGVRFSAKFKLRMKLKRKDQIERATKVLAEAETRQEGKGKNLHYVRGACYGLGMAMMYEGRPLQAAGLAKRVAGLTDEAIRDGSRVERAPRFDDIKPILWLCREICTADSYAIAKSAWEKYRKHVTKDRERAHAEEFLAEMALAIGSPGAARAHWERHLEAKGGRKGPSVDSYWPK